MRSVVWTWLFLAACFVGDVDVAGKRCPCPKGYGCDPIGNQCTLGPILHWRFDEGSGTSAQDSSMNRRVGILLGAQWTDGKAGSALKFDGVSSYVSAGLIPSSPEGTMSAWIRPDGRYSGNQAIFGGVTGVDGSDATARYLMYATSEYTAGCWAVVIGNGGPCPGNGCQTVISGMAFDEINFPKGVWTHVAVTYDGTRVKFYKNGALVTDAPQDVRADGDPQPFSIGREGGWERGPTSFMGSIDEVRVYASALSAEEIRAQ